MTDRELLEKAAKAAGMAALSDGVIYAGFGSREWNPLTDDGDALRLAVRLDMVINVNRVDEWTQVKCGYFLTEMMLTNESHNGDPYAATRRAIVRAAAALVPAQTSTLPEPATRSGGTDLPVS